MFMNTCILSYIYPFRKQHRAKKTIQSKRKKVLGHVDEFRYRKTV